MNMGGMAKDIKPSRIIAVHKVWMAINSMNSDIGPYSEGLIL